MLENYLYNLMLQLTEENKSLWRIKDEYIKDANSDSEVLAFWEALEKDKEDHVAQLSALIKSRIQ